MKIANQNKIARAICQKKSSGTTTFAPCYGGMVRYLLLFICLFRRRPNWMSIRNVRGKVFGRYRKR